MLSIYFSLLQTNMGSQYSWLNLTVKFLPIEYKGSHVSSPSSTWADKLWYYLNTTTNSVWEFDETTGSWKDTTLPPWSWFPHKAWYILSQWKKYQTVLLTHTHNEYAETEDTSWTTEDCGPYDWTGTNTIPDHTTTAPTIYYRDVFYCFEKNAETPSASTSFQTKYMWFIYAVYPEDMRIMQMNTPFNSTDPQSNVI